MRAAYRVLRFLNDLRAIDRAITTRSPDPIARRVARRVYGKATGRLAARLFG